MSKRICKCGNETFITTAVECHDWLVDGEGNFLEDKGCTEVYARPDQGNIWTCAKCGEEYKK